MNTLVGAVLTKAFFNPNTSAFCLSVFSKPPATGRRKNLVVQFRFESRSLHKNIWGLEEEKNMKVLKKDIPNF